MKVYIPWKWSTHNRFIILYLNILWVIDLSLILFNTSLGLYTIPKDSNYMAKFLPINNETQCVPWLFLSSRLITYTSSFILGKLFIEKTLLNIGS